MRRIAKTLALSIAAATLGGSAFAADLPSRKEAPPVAYSPPPLFTWTGFYIGLNAGAAIRDNKWGYSGFAPFVPANANNNVGFTGGGQLGYNWQMNSVVFGLETDLNYLSANNASNAAYFFGANNSTGGLLGTARGRLGLALDRWLIYATGGFAYGNAYYNTYYPVAGLPIYYGNSSSGMKVGWTVGGGVEWAIANNWSIKAEYLYTDIRRNSGNFGAAFWNQSAQNHVVRLGVNYHFN